MAGRILTEVSAVIDEQGGAALVDGFRALLSGPVPDGLLRTELLRGDHGQWRIQTLWRDRTALDAMRAAVDAPAAPQLFRSVGAEPTLTVLEVRAGHPDAGR